MDALDQDRFIVVGARQFDDVLELARLAAERLPQDDPLTLALIGAVAATRQTALPEP